MSNGIYEPGIYVKGDREKVADTPARAVALAFEGYVLKDTVPSETASYRDLQAQAKELGIPANQSEQHLREAIAALPPSVVVTAEGDDNDES